MVDPVGSASESRRGSGWQVESWRLTAFLTSTTAIPEQNWWTDLVGEAPEAEQNNRRQGRFQAHGAFGRGILVLTTQPGRVDWHYVAGGGPEVELPDADPQLGPWTESFEVFRPLVMRWLAISPPLNRLAVGTVLTLPAESRQDAYRIIAGFVPGLHLDSENCSDFLYQINRPRMSTIHSGLLINRLSKWSAALTSVLELTLADHTNVMQRQVQTKARLELDINTVPGYESVLDATEFPTLLTELVELGQEIAEHGDIP